MHFRITGDSDEESGISQFIYNVSGSTRKYFLGKDYGSGLVGICLVLMCHVPELQRQLKRRIRLSKKDSILYMDIMLDFDEIKSVGVDKGNLISQSIIQEVSEILSKYKIMNFDQERFTSDLKAWLSKKNQE